MKFLIPLFFVGFVVIGQGDAKVISAEDPDDGNATSNEDGSKIVGGQEISIGRVPYQVALLDTNGFAFCGGSILNEIYILTAAHCLLGVSARNLRIRAGAQYYYTGGQVRQVQAIITHPQFNRSVLMDNDIAILRINPLTFHAIVSPISLPSAGSLPPVGSAAIISGWGMTSSGGRGSHTLLGTMVYINNQAYCNSAFGGRITSRMICASAPGTDACYGDSGGPLVVGGILYGVTSFGEGCADPNYPGVYSSVANRDMRAWITQHTGL